MWVWIERCIWAVCGLSPVFRLILRGLFSASPKNSPALNALLRSGADLHRLSGQTQCVHLAQGDWHKHWQGPYGDTGLQNSSAHMRVHRCDSNQTYFREGGKAWDKRTSPCRIWAALVMEGVYVFVCVYVCVRVWEWVCVCVCECVCV